MINETDTYIEVDVREDIEQKIEPFDKIMGAVQLLKEDQFLILHAPFNPVPLHKVLQRRGFSSEPLEVEPKHWKVIYKKETKDTAE